MNMHHPNQLSSRPSSPRPFHGRGTGGEGPATSHTRNKLFYCFGQFGVGVYNGFNNAIIGLYILAFTTNPFLIGYLSNTRTIEGVIIQPLVGRWSDRMVSPLGRRRPFLLVCVPISVCFLALIPIVAHVASRDLALPLIVVTIVLFSVTWNMAADPYQSLMVDITRPPERAVFNSILAVISLLGQVVILLYASLAALKKNNIPAPVFYACVVLLLISFAVVFFGVREPAWAAETAQKEERIPLRVYLSEMRVFKEAFKLLVSVFFLWSGLNPIIPYLTVFTVEVMHVSKAEALWVYLTVILSAGVFAYPFGLLARRYGMRRMIVLGTVLLIAAAIGGTIAPTYLSLFPVAVLAGCGFSATTALTYPYLSQLVPASRIGVFTGLQSAFSAVALPLSVGAAALLIDLWGYRVIFPLLAVTMVVDIAFLLSINEEAARAQIRHVEETEGTAPPVQSTVSAP